MDYVTEFWKWAIGAGIGVNIFVLGLLLKIVLSMKAEVKGMIVEIKTETEKKLSRMCDDEKASHCQIWERIHHHAHTEGGNVIITE
jgi:hypothetical protein